MGKAFKGKLCVYCGKRLSATGDHVFCRGFCLEKHRGDLPQVPACDECNRVKSYLEHYLTTVLPFGARHHDSQETLITLVPKRLEKNVKLHRELKIGYIGEKIPLREGQIEPLFALITKGLLWHHWGITLTDDDCAAAIVVRNDGAGLLNHIFTKMSPRARVSKNLGDGALIYEGIQATDYAQFTLWRFLIYGGLNFAETSRDPNGKHCIIFAVTGPRIPVANFWATVFKEELPAA
jgi:hypothetical protein